MFVQFYQNKLVTAYAYRMYDRTIDKVELPLGLLLVDVDGAPKKYKVGDGFADTFHCAAGFSLVGARARFGPV